VDVLLAGHPMVAKKRLGREIVEQYHGADAATEAQAAFEKQFSRGEMPDDIEEVQIDGTVEYSVATLLRDCFGVSTSEARRMVQQNAVTIDGERPADANAKITLSDGQIIKMGKRRYAKLKLV
jgi:tyrosyl-tRNA synthetase